MPWSQFFALPPCVSPRPTAEPPGQPQVLAPVRFGCCSSLQAPTPWGRDHGSVCVQCSSQQGWKLPPAPPKWFPVPVLAGDGLLPSSAAGSWQRGCESSRRVVLPVAAPSPPPVQTPDTPPSFHCSVTSRPRPSFHAEILAFQFQVCQAISKKIKSNRKFYTATLVLCGQRREDRCTASSRCVQRQRPPRPERGLCRGPRPETEGGLRQLLSEMCC